MIGSVSGIRQIMVVFEEAHILFADIGSGSHCRNMWSIIARESLARVIISNAPHEQPCQLSASP